MPSRIVDLGFPIPGFLMFSTLTSFLPTALRDTHRTASFTPDNDDDEAQRREEPQPPGPEAEPRPQSPQRKRERGRRHANEVFVIVRPPPSKSNHPLNLQVQLVPPYSKGVLPRQSIDFESSQSIPLQRSPSNRSQESATTYGSTTSFVSTASGASTATSSTSSTRRAIVPLYNLQAHNVLPNVIVDAGTDAKVAKFQKRGIELLDLAMLEPVEVWPDPNAVVMPVTVTANTLAVPIVGPDASTSTLGRLSVDEMGFAQVNAGTAAVSGRSVAAFLATPVGANSRPATPDGLVANAAASSSTSLSLSHDNYKLTASPEPLYTPPTPATIPSTASKRNIFGKIFKKGGKDAASPVGSAIPTLSPSAPSNSIANNKQDVSTRLATSVHLQQGDSGHPPNLSQDQSRTPTQLQHTVTPTPHHHPYLGSTEPRPASAGAKGGSGIRGSWLIGSPTTTVKSPSQSSPLASAFSSLGITKRRPGRNATQPANGNPSINLNEAEESASHSAGLSSAHVLTSVPQPNQTQPQLSQPVLGVQPTLCVVPSSVVSASRSFRRVISKSHDDEANRSVERSSANGSPGPGKPVPKLLRKVYMYVWLARKWMKRRPTPPHPPNHKQENSSRFGLGLQLGSPGKGLGLDTTWIHSHRDRELSVEETVEVRFEWKRGAVSTNPKKKQNTNEGAATSAEGEQAEPLKRQSSRGAEGKRSGSRRRDEEEKTTRREGSVDDDGGQRSRKPSSASISSARAAVKRWSLLSHQSTSAASEGGDGDADSGDESDPEDSETPWVCTLKVRRTNIAAAKEAGVNHAPSNTSSNENRGRRKGGGAGDGTKDPGNHEANSQVLKIKVGTLSPTPHHPKVVAMLRVPFPLPDVQIERLEVVKRRGLGPSPQSGAVADGREEEDYFGLTLTAEEIKDIVCSTGLWLVVRENIGGVGKVQRKGDGWMIRS